MRTSIILLFLLLVVGGCSNQKREVVHVDDNGRTWIKNDGTPVNNRAYLDSRLYRQQNGFVDGWPGASCYQDRYCKNKHRSHCRCK